MGSMSIWHWVIVALVVLLLFGRGRISEMMGDLAKGIKSFKKGLAEDDAPATGQAPPQVTRQTDADHGDTGQTATDRTGADGGQR
ncbi:twin-arginine translocase TatA/TatE family subunit [Sandaracinobacteroides sp. A072]|uniref:twin-arginine translocase TatA/TatE family subunit n=1 Tax=Sandaracinobacteroides sp. A072 TaxID=3461146 RepID=UPI004041B0EF